VYHCVIDVLRALRAKLKIYVTQIKSPLSYLPRSEYRLGTLLVGIT